MAVTPDALSWRMDPHRISPSSTPRRASRKNSLSVARGEAGETLTHLRPSFVTHRIDERTFWRLFNRLMTIRRMLSSLMDGHD
jgi:four helix bundle protein